MVTLEDLTTSELQYVRSKWSSEKTELEKEKARRLGRLNNRLSNQAEDASAQAEIEADLAHAQAVLDQLVNSNADPTLINAQQEVVDETQLLVDNFGLSTSYVSNPDALFEQMALSELEFAVSERVAKVAEIDALQI